MRLPTFPVRLSPLIFFEHPSEMRPYFVQRSQGWKQNDRQYDDRMGVIESILQWKKDHPMGFWIGLVLMLASIGSIVAELGQNSPFA